MESLNNMSLSIVITILYLMPYTTVSCNDGCVPKYTKINLRMYKRQISSGSMPPDCPSNCMLHASYIVYLI